MCVRARVSAGAGWEHQPAVQLDLVFVIRCCACPLSMATAAARPSRSLMKHETIDSKRF